MRLKNSVALAAVGVAASATAVVLVRRARQGHEDAADPWPTVTIGVPPERLLAEGLPSPLRGIQPWAHVLTAPAPGGRGTEVSVRPRYGIRTPVDDRDQARKALRRTKQLIEVGEVLANDPKPVGRRPPTPAGLLVDAAARHADRKGVL